MTNITTGTARADFWPLSLHAVALVGPIALLAVGTAIDRTAGGADIHSYLERVAAAPGVYLASGLMMIAGMAGLVATAAAIVRLTAGTPRAALARVGGILIGVWGVCGVAGVGLGYTAGWVAVALQGDVPDAALTRLFEGVTYSPWGLIGGGGGGGAFVLGVLAAGIGLILARGIPSWTGILVLAAPVAMFTGGPLGIPLLAAAGFALMAIGLGGTIPVLLRKPPLIVAAAEPATASIVAGRPERSLLT